MNQNLAILLPLIIFFFLDLIFLINSLRNNIETKTQSICRKFCAVVALTQGFSVFLYANDFELISLPRTLVYIFTIVSVTLMTVASYYWFSYLIIFMPGKSRNSSLANFIYLIPIIIILITSIASIWTNWVFDFGTDSIYQPGKLFFLQILCPGSYGIMAVVITLVEVKNGNSNSISQLLLNFIFFVIPAALGIVIQTTVLRGGYSQIGISLGMAILYLEQYLGEINENKRLKSLEQINEQIKELNTSMQEQISITKSMSRVYYLVYVVNLDDDTFYEINSRDKVKNVVDSQTSAKESFKLVCDTMIEECIDEYREFVDLTTIQDRLRNKQFITCDYKGKFSGWSQAYFIAGERDENGKFSQVFYATRTNLDEKEREEEAKAVIEGLSREYHSVWLIDKKTLAMKLIRSEEIDTIREASNMGTEYADFVNASNKYIETYVVSDDRERVRSELRPEEVLEHVNKSKDMLTVNYLRKEPNGKVGYHQVGFVDASTSTGKEQFVMAFRNVDKVVKAEQKVKMELEEARIAAEAANEAKTIFLNNMSHDIRTPMNAIMGFTELLEIDKNNPDKISEYVSKIKNSEEYLLAIINNVLDMARIESGYVEVDEVFMDLSDENSSAIPIFAELTKKKNINFTAYQDLKHPYVLLDKIKIQQIAVNLLGNAMKYTPDGGRVELSLVEYPCEREGYGTYEMKISDTGIGMSEEFKEHIFDYFSRERNTTESKIVGTGLGMSIVKHYVDMMGGSITVDSKIGEGTTFTVVLDHKIITNPQDYIVNNEKENSGKNHVYSGKRILLAEDNDLNAEITVAMLENVGVKTDRAEDGIECIKMLNNADEDYYDLILMDIQMPNLNGYDTTRKIRHLANKRKALIPIIAMTANAFEEDKRMAIEAGMNGHLAKPVNTRALLEKLMEY